MFHVSILAWQNKPSFILEFMSATQKTTRGLIETLDHDVFWMHYFVEWMKETSNTLHKRGVELRCHCAWLCLHFVDDPGGWVDGRVDREHLQSLKHWSFPWWSGKLHSRVVRGEHSWVHLGGIKKRSWLYNNSGEFQYFKPQNSPRSLTRLSLVICHVHEMRLVGKCVSVGEIKWHPISLDEPMCYFWLYRQ